MRSLVLAVLIVGAVVGSLDARGFGGAAFWSPPGGDGIGGSGALWTDSIMGSGAMYADSAYGAGLPWFEGIPGGGAAYGGFFSGPPQLNMKRGGDTYNPLAGEQALGGDQLNVNAGAQRQQAFASSLAGMGIGMGGFQPGQFGPPPKSGGLPSDLGMHAAGGKSPSGFGKSGAGARDLSAANLRVFGNSVRSDFRDYSAFGQQWFAQHPRAWSSRGLARDVWTGCDWADANAWLGGELPDYDYMYGSDLVYDGNTVYLYGRPVAAADKYYESAVNLARAGGQGARQAATSGEWLPLGVFEAIRGDKKSSTMLFQLAVNKAGTVRGNYFNTADGNVQNLQGSVDKGTQRMAWIVTDKKDVVFDCVVSNLTRPETTVLVHLGPDKNEQWTLVRLARNSGGAAR